MKQIFDAFIKTFCRKWEGEIFPKWLFLYKQPEKCQNEYCNDHLHWVSCCRRTSLHVLMFPISLLKRNLWKWRSKEQFGRFSWHQKSRFVFLITHLFLIFVSKEFFKYIEMGLKTFLIIFKGFFEWQKSNIAIVTLSHADI